MAERGRGSGRQSPAADKAATEGRRTTQQSDKQDKQDKPDKPDKKDTRTMAELTIQPDEIRDALANFIQAYEPEGASRQEVGTVAEAGDGIARVEGLPSAMANELLEFPGGIRGLALNLDIREIGVVILGDFSRVEEGQQVRRTGEVLSVPVGDGLVASIAHPGGNVTGFTNGLEESIGGKWIEMLREIAPNVTRFGIMYNPRTAPGGGAYYMRLINRAADTLRVRRMQMGSTWHFKRWHVRPMVGCW